MTRRTETTHPPPEPVRPDAGSADPDVQEVPNLTLDSTVTVVATVHKAVGKGLHLIGPVDRPGFIELDDDAVMALHLLGDGRTLRDAGAELQALTGDEYDMLDFVSFIADRYLVAAVDGIPLPCGEDREHHGILERVPPAWLSWMQSPLLVAGLLGLWTYWIHLLVDHPWLYPDPAYLRVVPSPTLTFLLAFGGLTLMAYVHELAHYFMARSYGLRPFITVSHRFYVMVLQTDVTSSWMLPRSAQLRIFLAGMALNLSFIAGAGIASHHLVTEAGYQASDPLVRGLLMLTYVNYVPIIFQFFIFARTDLYYVMLVLSGERNLAQDAREYWKFRFLRIGRRLARRHGGACASCQRLLLEGDPFCLRCGTDTADPRAPRVSFQYRSRRTLNWVGPMFLLGHGYAILFFLFIVPRIQHLFLSMGVTTLQESLALHNWWGVAEAVGFLVIMGLQLAIMVWLLSRRVLGILAPFFRLVLRAANGLVGLTRTNTRSVHEPETK